MATNGAAVKAELKAELKTGVYAGTFDPITVGHLDILRRALTIVDRLYVGVADDTSKSVLFSTAERTELVKDAVAALDPAEQARITVESFTGLLVEYVRSRKAQVIIRGLRVVSDYEYEAQMAHINRYLDKQIETVFLVASKTSSFISSSIVKNIARNGGDVSGLVPPNVVTALARARDPIK